MAPNYNNAVGGGGGGAVIPEIGIKVMILGDGSEYFG